MPRSRVRPPSGFTLVELAVVLTIVAFLLASLMLTLSAQTEQRNLDETRRRLETARELIMTYAAVNGRLPCPARSAATAAPVTVSGDEVRNSATNPDCVGDAVTDYYGGTSGGVTLGLLPARTIGFQQVDPGGLAIDAWGNRIRYAVAYLIQAGSCTAPTSPHFTHATNLRNNGIACRPSDLIICKSATGITGVDCGGASNQIMSQNLVVAVIFSTGKNGGTPTGGTGLDEAANLNGDRVFVFHTPTPSDFANGEYDDQFTWITVGELYGRMIAAGTLP
jgi:prepilin-type N-terminal cleavage/methylation domain-containing protein